jgi:DHA1 family bicyclomycin/chloramphenicol resistance-like MFS transporter
MLDVSRPVTARPAIPGGMVPTLAVLICLSAAAIDVSMPALPVVAGDLGTSVTNAQFAISFYLAGYALAQIPLGLAADRFGRLPVLHAGLALFTLAGLVATFAWRIEVLLAARLIQGLAGATGPLLARTIIRDTSEGARLSPLMSLMVTVLGVSTLAAPVVGAALTEWIGWRSTFGASVVLGLVLVALARRYVPETRPDPGFLRKSVLGQFGSSLRAFASTPQCLWGTALVALPFGGYMAIVVSAAPVLVEGYGFPVIAVGPIFAAAVLAYILGAWLSRRLVGRLGIGVLLAMSVAAFAVAAAILGGLFVTGTVPFTGLAIGIVAYLFGIGMIVPNATSIALDPLPNAAGFGSAILGTLQIGGGAIGSALAATIFGGGAAGLTAVTAIAGMLTVFVFAGGRAWIRPRDA